MTTKLQSRYKIKGAAFGSRGCSCPCDPCDCNPCNCGDEVRPPLWRISGFALEAGSSIQAQDVSHMLLFSLACPVDEGENTFWQEVILVDERATDEQIVVLLSVFEDELNSLPAEIPPTGMVKQAVYRASMDYGVGTEGPWLRVLFVPDHSHLVREGAPVKEAFPRLWSYDGRVALRRRIDLTSLIG